MVHGAVCLRNPSREDLHHHPVGHGKHLSQSGAFTQGGQSTVGAVTTAQAVGVGKSASRTRGQQISLPVVYAPLSSLPDVEMSRQVGYETEILAQNDNARHNEVMQLIANREALRQRVQA